MEVGSGFGIRTDVKEGKKGDQHRGCRDSLMSHDRPVPQLTVTQKSVALQ
jgi:hypothetical protein